jgi:ribosomal-protein-alanine N-acetyltransferase
VTLPRLHGPRVVLVPVERPVAQAVVAADTQALTAALADASLHAGPGWPHADTVDALRPLAEHGGRGCWLVVDGDSVVGDCGWLGGPDATGDAEIGYGLAAPSRGQGLGTEAVALLAAWAEQQQGVHRVVAEVLQGNEASRRLLHRLGFDEEATLPPYIRYVRTRNPRPRLAGRHVC